MKSNVYKLRQIRLVSKRSIPGTLPTVAGPISSASAPGERVANRLLGFTGPAGFAGLPLQKYFWASPFPCTGSADDKE
jgi:hypothetical protein